jgi:hydrogenase expression/formation protein HypD
LKYIDEFRDAARMRDLAHTAARLVAPDREYRLMEFCGGHTHAIARYGLAQLLPENIRLIHGPGCPVCVLPASRIATAIDLACDPRVTLCVYGDLMRVPVARNRSLLTAKAAGADIRVVYSTLDALRIAAVEPEREVVFFGIGFETTTPATALAIKFAAQRKLENFSIYCNHVLTPAALRAILEGARPDMRLDGVIGPSHVSTIIGLDPYRFVVDEYDTPIVVAGFEPLDVMLSIVMLLKQIGDGRCELENQYNRAVETTGNRVAQTEIASFLERRDSFEWRGLGNLPGSGLRIRATYAPFDAEARHKLTRPLVKENPACACGAVLRGETQPQDCRLFGTICTPETPIGSCMVSTEGACAAAWLYRRRAARSSVEPPFPGAAA